MAQEFLAETEKRTPIVSSYDTVIVGAGMGGVSAALAAARHGRKVLLVERMFAVGGLATLGLITIYLPLCDGKGRQVCKGLNDELLRLAISHGFEDKYPDTWLDGKGLDHHGQRFEVGYNAQVFAILMEQKLKEAGCDILYGTNVVGVSKKNKAIDTLIVENKNGREAIRTNSVIDATGDADVCVLAGVPVLNYTRGNALASWFYETKNGKTVRRMLGAADVLPDDPSAEIPEKLESQRYSGIDAWETSRMVENAHRTLLRKFFENGEVSQSHSLATIPSIPQVRMTRKLVGLYTISDTEQHHFMSDSIGLISDWRKNGPVYEVPFRCLFSGDVVNLAVVGRCISVSDGMWDITRVIPPAVVSGQAAGTALSLGYDLSKMDLPSLQKELRKDGVVIHETEL